MRLLLRLGEVLSANASDLLDRLEDPERMLRFSIRELEESVEPLFRATASVIAGGRMLSRRIAEREENVERLTTLVQQSVARGDDETARQFLGNRRDAQADVQSLKAQLEISWDLEKRLRHRLAAVRSRLESERFQLTTLAARHRSAVAYRHALRHAGHPIAAGSATRMERFRQEVEESEVELEALWELSGEAPIDESERTREIEIELQSIKASSSA